jgi:DDE family transposase
MSFRSSRGEIGRAFECVRRSLHQADELPFSNVLTADRLAEVFESEGVDCCDDDDPDVIYTPAVTLWAFLSQMLFTGEQRSCTAAVARVAAVEALSGRVVSNTNTGAYCRARRRIPEGVPKRLTCDIARDSEAQVPDEWCWKGHRAFLVDGSTISMPDTPENQAEYPQSSSQAEGLGFPVMRVVALLSLATAMIQGLALGPCSGKETGETALFRQLFDLLKPGDVVVADRYYAGWFTIALLQELGVEVVTRLHQHREADFRRGRRLGADDHLVDWPKPQRPDWLDQETYDRLPDTLSVREMKFAVRERGFRTQSIVVVATLRDETTITREDLADLFRQRWNAELDLRNIKSTMSLDVLRCQTPEMVRTELWMGLLAYNLVRHSLLQAADAAECSPRQLSFCAAQQFLAGTWLLAAVDHNAASPLIELRLTHMASHRVGNRPNRIEPRAIKRRAQAYDWLTKPRATARVQLLMACSP